MRIWALLLVSPLFAQTVVINGGGSAAVPTMASTGFSSFTTHPQSSATITDSTAGIVMSSPDFGADNMNTSCIAAPATPYTITAKVSVIQNWGSTAADSYGGLAWRDSSSGKIQTFGILSPTVQQGNWPLQVPTAWAIDWSNPTTYGNGSEGNIVIAVPTAYFQISDDGTTVSQQVSYDGGGYYPISSVAKSAGYLGSAGYKQVCIFISAHGGTAKMTLQSYAKTSP